MTTQEQAFTAYYASMTDAELLRTAANRASFVETAQRLLAQEMARRHLEVRPAADESTGVTHPHSGAVAKLLHKLHFG